MLPERFNRLSGVVLLLFLGAACGGGGSTGPSGPPVLSFINDATKPSGPIGSTVILEGSALGASQGTSQVVFSNGTGGTVAATIASPADWTDGFIVTTVPSGAATGAVKVVSARGTSDSLIFTVTQNAAFSPSTISWTATTSLPVGLSGHAAAVATVGTTSYVYVTGGADSTYAPRDSVYYAAVQANGTLGIWSKTAVLPGPRAFAAMVAATPFNSRVTGNGFLYALGGDTAASGKPTNTIYRGTLGTGGVVTSWISFGALPGSLHAVGAAVFHSNLYIAGGSTSGNVPVSTVYRAALNPDGTLGTWRTEAALPFARSYHAFTSFGEYLYAIGGDSGIVTPNDSGAITGTKTDQIAYAHIDLRTGDLTTGWVVNGNTLTKAISKGTAVVAGGDVLATAGLYNSAGTGSSEEKYAQLNVDGSLGNFNGATGSHTITSAGGKDLFNHAALSYVDGSGTAHLLVLGGDDVNAPGKKRAEVWFY